MFLRVPYCYSINIENFIDLQWESEIGLSMIDF